MSDQKNIDNLFREAFKDFEATPDPALWDKISSKLDEKTPQPQKEKEGVVFLPWLYRIVGIAAAILLLFALGSQFFGDDSTVINPENQTTSTTKDNTDINTNNENNDANQKRPVTGSDTQITDSETTTNDQNLQNTKTDQNNMIDQKDRIATENSNQQHTDTKNTTVNDVNKKSLQKGSALQNAVATQENQTNLKNADSQESSYKKNKINEAIQNKNNINTTQNNAVAATNSNTTNSNANKNSTQTNDKNSNAAQNNTLNTKNDKYANAVAENSTNTHKTNKIGVNGSATAETTQNTSKTENTTNTAVAQNDTNNKLNTANTVNDPKTATELDTTEEAVASNTNEEKKEDTVKKSLLDVINDLHELEKDTEVAEEEDFRRWTISPNASPVYYNSFADGSPIGSTFVDNSKTGDVNLSVGVNVGYDVSKRLTIRSGIHRVNYSYSTNDVAIVPSVNTGTLPVSANDGLVSSGSIPNNVTNIAFTQNASTYSLRDKQVTVNGEFEQALLDTSIRQAQIEGSLNQRMSYIEVPIELKYAVLDKKVGINLIGGVSTLVLTENSIVLDAPSLSAELGESTNINDVSFSTNIGIGVDYKLSDKLEFNLEPMLKYQLNAFSGNTGNFRPYSVGVYTGVSFRF